MTRKKYFSAVCGIKNSGKTTLLEGLIRILTARGLKVAVIKHDGHDFECDIPGTDSRRYVEAGAFGASVYSKSQFFIRKMRETRGAEDSAPGLAARSEKAGTCADGQAVEGAAAEARQDRQSHRPETGEREFLRSLAGSFAEADVLLVEGGKDYPFRKIEVVRSPVSRKPVSNPAGLYLVVSDLPQEEIGIRTLPFEELEQIADAVLETEAEGFLFEDDHACAPACPGKAGMIRMSGQTIPEKAADCCAVLLRGGKSRRMGRDKALLTWERKSFLETVADQMDIFGEKYLSVAADPDRTAPQEKTVPPAGNPDGLPPEWKVLPDKIPDCGPLGGIWTALTTCRAEWALAASCDIPAVRRSFFVKLLDSRSEDVDIVCPVTPDGRMHMTCALYRRAAAPMLEARIRSGDYRMRGLFSSCRVKTIPVTDPEEVRMLSNINTAEELDRVRRG